MSGIFSLVTEIVNFENFTEEYKLMAAVFERSVLDFLSNNPIFRADAADWFFSDETQHLYSFTNICLFMHWDPTYVISLLLKKQKERAERTEVFV